MKISASRSSILTVIAIAVLLATLPSGIRKFVQTGDPYLFTRRFYDDMLARLSGLGRLRFILQPAASLVLGVRGGIRDARTERPPFLSGLLLHRTHRAHLLRSAFTSVRDLVAIAIVVDIIAQLLIFKEVHPGAALVLGPVLIAVPYSLSRDLSNRAARRRNQQASVSHPS